MSNRFAFSFAALSVVALLGACAVSTGSSTTPVSGSGSENCLEAIKRQAHTSAILGSTAAVSAQGVTTVNAEVAGAQNWSCIAGPDGTVESVMRSNPRNG